MVGILTYFSAQLVAFWNFASSVKVIGGPSLLQIIIAGVFTSLTFAFLFWGVRRKS